MCSPRLIWTDIETFGLDPERDPIIEIGFRITDLELNTLNEISVLVWDEGIHDTAYKNLHKKVEGGDEGAKFVLDMHNKSGLWNEARFAGSSSIHAEELILTWMNDNEINGLDPLCGSSVGFDRAFFKAQMYKVEERFHYRNIDISSLKELCKRFNPRVASLVDENTKPQKLHRALPDLDDSIAEFRYYLENFLWTEEA